MFAGKNYIALARVPWLTQPISWFSPVAVGKIPIFARWRNRMYLCRSFTMVMRQQLFPTAMAS
ncbi:MAG TPA: hypothetical protein VGJ04_06425 [Pirellulales bacterium]